MWAVRLLQSTKKPGGADWQKAKSKAKRAMREIAAQLVKLYAARQATRGHEFGPDTPWQSELEDAFPIRRRRINSSPSTR